VRVQKRGTINPKQPPFRRAATTGPMCESLSWARLYSVRAAPSTAGCGASVSIGAAVSAAGFPTGPDRRPAGAAGRANSEFQDNILRFGLIFERSFKNQIQGF